MRRNILTKTVYVLLFLAVLAGCKVTKVVISSPPELVEMPVLVPEPDNTRKDKLNSIHKNNIVFNTLSVKSKAVLSISDKINDVNMNFRIKNNEVIWVSVTAIAGLEVARALITPDSVKILNRIDNIYISKPFTYIHEFTNDQINFNTLQAILIGNTVSELINDSTELKIENNETKLSSIIGGLAYSIRVGDQNKVIYANLNDLTANQELNANYTDFMMVNEQQIPHAISMDSKVKAKKFLLELKFLKIDLNGSIELPFRVPERFLIKN